MAVQWVPSSNGFAPDHAVKGCRDVDGNPLFIGRAFHHGDMLPAKISPRNGTAYVCYAGGEHQKNEYEALCSSRVAWQFARGGHVPHRAVEGGQTVGGEKLYIGRTLHEGSLTPGKIQPSHGVLYIPFGGEEKSFPEYEVLIEV